MGRLRGQPPGRSSVRTGWRFTVNRRAVMQSLVGAAVYGAIGNGRAQATGTLRAVATLADGALALQFDSRLHGRVAAGSGAPLADFGASEYVVTDDGRTLDAFAFVEQRRESVRDAAHGRGQRLTLRGEDRGLTKTVQVTLYERHPGFAILTASYHNASSAPLRLGRWVNCAHGLPSSGDGLPFGSFSGASHEDRRDWVQRAAPGFAQRNFMGMNAADYGGGTPVVDVWRRDVGLAVGHVETRPRLVALPLTVTATGSRVAVECEVAITLAPGERFTTPDTFVAVHRGDYYATLVRYREVMAERGLRAPPPHAACYEPVWCAWGYERDFTVEQVLATLPKARELGLVWAGVDDGWQTSEGDWYLDPKKFPRGDADMLALSSAIKAAGMKPKLWIAPLAVDPGTDLLHDATDLLLLNEDGSVRDVTWWNSFYLCPAYSKTVERSQALVRKILGEWGFMGLKIDGQHLNGVAPCYNPAHAHPRPEESFEKLQDFWQAIYRTALSVNPEAVVEICPCGTSYAFHNMPAMNQTVASDPLSSWQVRLKGKTIKALMGPSAAYAGDHVELSDHGDDFASTVGVGAVVATKFTWPSDPRPENGLLLTPAKEREWRRWISLYHEKRLPQGRYRGELYDIAFDAPEAHAIEKDGRLYYAFYAERWDGSIELRGLKPGRYSVTDYVNGKSLGMVSVDANRLQVAFERYLLLEATPATGARA
jgi:alpha-galactosidase